jgi:glycosyltransferase involved in cell wall biosynthesis
MTHPDNVIFIPLKHPTEALKACAQACEENSSAEFVCFHSPDVLPSSKLLSRLLSGLRPEKVLAVQPRKVADSAWKDNVFRPSVITAITSSLSVFKLQAVCDYLTDIQAECDENATVTDISVFLNRLGLSSLSVPVPESDVNDIVLDQKASSTPREWDGYIAHLDNFWNEVKPEWSHHFKDVLALPHTPQLLIDATGLEPVLNGTSRVAINVLDQLHAQISSDNKEWNVTVVVPNEARTQLGLNYPGFACVESLENIDNTFDVAVSITPINTVSRCVSVLRMSLRWMVIHLDIIAIRSLPHLSQHVQARAAVEFYLENADEIITISDFSRNDLVSYFGDPDTTRIKVATLGIPESLTSNTLPEEFDPTSGGVFVVGNALPHKQVNKAVQVLISAGLNVTTIGDGEPLSPLHRVVSPRDTDDAMFSRILNESSVVVFPSRYEGFGLPIAEAAQAKRPILLADTEINREVTKLLGRDNQTVFFTKLKDIPAAVSQAQQLMNSDNGKIPLLSDFSEHVLHEAQSLLSQPLDFAFVEKRWHILTFMHAAMTEQEEHTIHELSQRRFSKRISHKFTGFFR